MPSVLDYPVGSLRLKWVNRFRELAHFWSGHSTCLHRKVGAVLFVPPYNVVSLGYNDTPAGEPNCGDGGCVPCQGDDPTRLLLDCRCVHAEMNCLLLAAANGCRLAGTVMVCTEEPCPSCRKHLAQAKVTWIT